MTDVNLFATQVTSAGVKPQALSGAQSGLTGIGGGVEFFNILFNNLLESNLTGDEKGKKSEEALAAENLLKSVTDGTSADKLPIDIALLQSVINGETSGQAIEEQLGELKVERLIQFMDGLTNGTPQDINKLVDSEEGAESLLILITSGLNPAEISKVTQRIEEVEAKLGRELTLDDLVAGVGGILSQASEDDATPSDFLGVLLKASDVKDTEKADYASIAAEEEKAKKIVTDNQSTDIDTIIGAIKNGESMDDIARQLNRIPVGSGTEDDIKKDTTVNAIEDVSYEFGGLIAGKNIPANDFIKNAQLIGNGIGKVKAAQNTLQSIQSSNTANLPAMTGFSSSSMSFAALSGEFFADEFASYDGIEYNVQTGSPFNSTMQAAHATSMTAQAGNTHPATQMVAAHISKAAQNGNTQNMTLQLDPPELGRVEVRLEFGADNSVKANLIVEKPETYLMLQRDANALEKALQNAGLETGSDSLNYDMAESGYFSDDNKNGRNSGQQASNASNSDNDEEIEVIETTMTWVVDPETGHMRYNILA